MADNKQSGLELGQHYKNNGVTWEIVGFRSINDIPHVQILKVGDHHNRKLISARTLLDRYNLAAE